jgi:GNAT superfamily N-acetyltransferase
VPFLERLVHEATSLVFISEQDGSISGFIAGRLVPAPPVYDPGGPVCLIDDFVVADPERWFALGAALFARLEEAALAAGAVLTVTVCGAADEKKLAMIEESGATPTSYWCVKELSSR